MNTFRKTLVLLLMTVVVTAVTAEGAKVICFDLINLSETRENSDLGDFFSDSISISLEAMGFAVVDETLVDQMITDNGFTLEELTEKKDFLALGREVGAGALIQGFYRMEEGTVFLAIKAYDVETGRIAAGINEQGPAGLQLYDTIDDVVVKVSQVVDKEFAPLKSAVVTVETEEEVTQERVVEEFVELGGETLAISLTSEDEGATLDLGEYFGTGFIQDGRFTFRCKIDTKVRVRIHKAGYQPRWYSFTVKTEQTEYPLPRLRPRAASGAGRIQWTLQKPMGLGYIHSFALIPDTLEAPLGGGIYGLPFYYGEEGDFFGGGLWAVNLSLEGGLNWRFITPPGGWLSLAAGTGFSFDNFIFMAALGDEAESWLGFLSAYLSLTQEIRISRRLILSLQEQYRTPGLLGPAPVTGNGFGQFLINMGVQWLL